MTTLIQAFPTSFLRRLRTVAGSLCVCLLAACGGGSADAPPPDEGVPGALAPVITQQPADLSVASGQPASFTVAASGTAPLAYQWQRNGSDIAGATAATYALTTTAPTDTGAVFRAIVSNVAGSATSNDATLTVTTAPPVLTITQQPADASVTAGTSASFTVAATCSSGTLNIQWQRSSGNGAAFAAVPSATSASYSLATASTDTGAQFRAQLDCSGQAATTSQVATLTVTAPGSVVLSAFVTAGLRDQAIVGGGDPVIDQEASGSYALTVGNRVKRISADLSTITPVAGASNNASGSDDGPGEAARFNGPAGLAHDAAGNVYVADTLNNTIRRIAPDGSVTTLAGLAGSGGNADGTGSAARFQGPRGLAIGPDGDLYVADESNSRIRRVTMAGVVTTYAGSGIGYADNASPLLAQFNYPRALAIAPNGDVLVADTSNNRIRRILRSGNGAGAVQTLAGNGAYDAASPDGVGTAAGIGSPFALALRGNTLAVRDGIGLLRMVDLTTAAVTTFTGSRVSSGYADGPATVARLRSSGYGLTTAPNGGYLLADSEIRTVSASGEIATIASYYASSNNVDSVTDGTGVLAQLPLGRSMRALMVDSAGRVLFGDSATKLLRRIDGSGQVSLIAGLIVGYQGMVDGQGSTAQFSSIQDAIAQDSAGNLYVGDYAAVRKIAPDGTMTLLAGARVGFPDDGVPKFGAVDGQGENARFNSIGGLAIGPDGAIYVGDPGNRAVRRIDAAGNVTTYAGALGVSGQADGPVATARFRGPQSLAFAPDGSLYVSDAGQLRRISADGSTVTTISAIALGHFAFGPDGTLYFGGSGTTGTGLLALSPGATDATLLIAGGQNDAVVLGNAPHLNSVAGLAVLGPKQLVLLSGGQLLKVTLP